MTDPCTLSHWQAALKRQLRSLDNAFEGALGRAPGKVRLEVSVQANQSRTSLSLPVCCLLVVARHHFCSRNLACFLACKIPATQYRGPNSKLNLAMGSDLSASATAVSLRDADGEGASAPVVRALLASEGRHPRSLAEGRAAVVAAPLAWALSLVVVEPHDLYSDSLARAQRY